MKESGVYVASRASVLERGKMWRELKAKGWPITSSWIFEDGPGQTASMSELWSRILQEVARSQALVIYAEPGDLPLKGAFIEAGAALALGKPVLVVAPGIDLGSWTNHPFVTRYDTLVEVERALIEILYP